MINKEKIKHQAEQVFALEQSCIDLIEEKFAQPSNNGSSALLETEEGHYSVSYIDHTLDTSVTFTGSIYSIYKNLEAI